MKIDSVVIHRVSLPFASSFSHSLRNRTSVNNIIVEIIAHRGQIKGYGEGAPRSYVTGETPAGVTQCITGLLEEISFPWELNEVSQIWRFVDGVTDKKERNVAICALEMALLDTLGKYQNTHILEYFPHDHYSSQISYGAALPLADADKIRNMCRMAQQMQMTKLKLKLGKVFSENASMLKVIRSQFGKAYDLKVDVNGVWNRQIAERHVDLIKEYDVKIVEQPMAPGDPDIGAFAHEIKKCGIRLMADESACTLEETQDTTREGFYDMMNIRLSKCGGFRNSFKIIDYLRKYCIPFQIGCQLGESGLLSAAGRALSLLCKDARYYDGSYDEFLLKENITTENVTFGLRGEAGPLEAPGLGVEVSGKNLKCLSDDSVFLPTNHLRSQKLHLRRD